MDHKRQVCSTMYSFNNIIYFYRGPHWVKAIMCLRQEGKLCRVPSKVIDTKYHKE